MLPYIRSRVLRSPDAPGLCILQYHPRRTVWSSNTISARGCCKSELIITRNYKDVLDCELWFPSWRKTGKQNSIKRQLRTLVVDTFPKRDSVIENMEMLALTQKPNSQRRRHCREKAPTRVVHDSDSRTVTKFGTHVRIDTGLVIT